MRVMMRIRWVLGAACFLGALVTTAGAEDRPEALVDGFARAWNAHDMVAFGQLFTDDADFVNVAGMWWKGRPEIQAKHQETHANRFKASTLSPSGTSVRLLSADVAVIHFTWELTGEVDRQGTSMPVRHGIMMMVAARQADGWKIVAAQNTNAAIQR